MSSVKLDLKKCLGLIDKKEKKNLHKWLKNDRIKEAIDNGDWKFLYKNTYLNNNKFVSDSTITTLLSSIGIDLLKELKDIPHHSFQKLYIEELNLDASTDEIGYGSFSGAIFSDTNLFLPKGIKLRHEAFSESNVSYVKIDCDSIGQHCFSECSDLKTVEIGSNLDCIPYSCFKKCVNLTTVKISNAISEEKIDKDAFEECSNLNHIEYQGQVFTSVNKFRNYLSTEIKSRAKVKNTWYRINNGMAGYGSYILACHITKRKGIIANMIPAINTGRKYPPIFFKSEKEAENFVKNNPNEFDRFSNLNIYAARLDPINDVGFIKIKTNLGNCYVQSHKADELNLQPGTYTIEV